MAGKYTLIEVALLSDLLAYFASAENIRVKAEADLVRRLRELCTQSPRLDALFVQERNDG